MNNNPYKYKGPLDPDLDRLVCVPRSENVGKVVEGIMTRGEFYAVLGPRQIGKTTFLRQIEKSIPNATFIFLDFQVSHESIESFYKWLRDRFVEVLSPGYEGGSWDDGAGCGPEFKFFTFLENFTPKTSHKNIVLLFDEIERIPAVKNFLQIWRKVFHERYRNKALEKYSLILSGSSDLLKLSISTNTAFNVSEIYYIKDFSDKEVELLISAPFEQLGINIQTEAKELLKSQVCGHPQLLQQACHMIVEIGNKEKRTIHSQDVNRVFKKILSENLLFDTLKQDLKDSSRLRKLCQAVLNGGKKKYFPYKEYSVIGAGAIIERDGFCAIRNKLYEQFLQEIFENTGENSWA